MRSPPWFCLSFSLFFPGSSQARSSGLSGNLPCDIWPPVLRQKVKKGGPDGMEMQKNSTAHNLRQQQQQPPHFPSQPLGDVTGFSYTRQTAAHPQLAQAGTPERASPLRSKQQNAKGSANKKIFPWMKECRHSEEKSARRIAGLCDAKSERPLLISDPLSETSACVFVLKFRKLIGWYDQAG